MEDQIQLVDMDSWYLILASALLVVASVCSAVIMILLLVYLPSWGNGKTTVYREREEATPKRRGRPPKKGIKSYQQHGARVVKSVKGVVRDASNAEIDQRFYDEL